MAFAHDECELSKVLKRIELNDNSRECIAFYTHGLLSGIFRVRFLFLF